MSQFTFSHISKRNSDDFISLDEKSEKRHNKT